MTVLYFYLSVLNGRTTAKLALFSTLKLSLYIRAHLCSSVCSKKTESISSCYVEDLFIIKNGYTSTVGSFQ